MPPQYIGDSMSSIKSTVSQNAQALSSKARSAKTQTQAQVDAHFPPSQRSQLANSIRRWASEHPKLFYLLLPHLFLTLPPLLIFLTFSTITLLTSLAVCITTAIITALLFTSFCIGGALLILLPVLFVAFVNATLLFVAGVIAYWILRRFAESETPVPFAEGLLEKIRAMDEGVTGSRAPRMAPIANGSGASFKQAPNGEKKSQYAGLVNGVGGEEREGRPASLFGILDDDESGMPDSTKKALRDISQRREMAAGQA